MKHLYKKGHKHSEETRKKISKALKKNSYLKGKKGSQSPKWKGGEMIFQGYILIYAPNHEGSNKKGYIKRANLVWYEKTNEIIKLPYFLHHINGIKTDDKFENLEKVNRSEHMKIEHKNKDYCKMRGKHHSQATKDKISNSLKKTLKELK